MNPGDPGPAGATGTTRTAEEERRSARPAFVPRRLLVPTDFGPSAEAALDYALELAAAFGAEVVLGHAFPSPAIGFLEAGIGIEEDLRHRIQERARADLDALVRSREGRGVPLRGHTEQSDIPWRGIIDLASREDADLIIMGTHGRHGIQHALLGSIAERVMRASPVPVLIVRRGQTRGREDARRSSG